MPQYIKDQPRLVIIVSQAIRLLQRIKSLRKDSISK